MPELLERGHAAAEKFSWSLPTKVLLNLATSDVEKFTLAFRRLRQAMPEQSIQACIYFLATHDAVPASHLMTFWLTLRDDYVSLLLDSDFLTTKEAGRAAAVLRSADPHFFTKFRNLVTESEITDKRYVRRTLAILGALGDYSVLLPWLRSLTHDTDQRIRSQAVKLMCELRPNKALIERQLQDEDPRVRANAVEALWHTLGLEAKCIFKSAAASTHHRVAANGLLGLFFQGDSAAVDGMIELASHPDPLFRAAMAWALGQTHDRRALSVLKILADDPVPMVHEQAVRSAVGIPELPEPEFLEPEPIVEQPAPEPPPAPASVPEPEPAYIPRFWQG